MRTWLIDKRKEKGYSQDLIAKSCGISQQVYSLYETGSRRPRPEIAMKLASMLGFSWTDFYEDRKNAS